MILDLFHNLQEIQFKQGGRDELLVECHASGPSPAGPVVQVARPPGKKGPQSLPHTL